MKFFVSYRRKSWPFTRQLVDKLRERTDAEIFLDYQSIDEANFQTSILHHLRKSDAVFLIVSEYTFAPELIHRDADWVRREIREALKLKKQIIVVFIDNQMIPENIPDDIQEIRQMQGVSFSAEYFDAAVDRLADHIAKIMPPPLMRFDDEEETQEARPIPTLALSLDVAMSAIATGDYELGISLLEDLIASGFKSQFFSLEDVLADAEHQHRLEQRRKKALDAYGEIAALAKSAIMLPRARKAWAAFRREYPEFTGDPENLVTKLQPVAPNPPKRIEEVIVSGSNRSPATLSLEDVLTYFAESSVGDESSETQPPNPSADFLDDTGLIQPTS